MSFPSSTGDGPVPSVRRCHSQSSPNRVRCRVREKHPAPLIWANCLHGCVVYYLNETAEPLGIIKPHPSFAQIAWLAHGPAVHHGPRIPDRGDVIGPGRWLPSLPSCTSAGLSSFVPTRSSAESDGRSPESSNEYHPRSPQEPSEPFIPPFSRTSLSIERVTI